MIGQHPVAVFISRLVLLLDQKTVTGCHTNNLKFKI